MAPSRTHKALAIAFCAALPWLPRTARAGAWTEPAGHWQVITMALDSQARRGFDARGRATVPLQFAKALFQSDTEYGWNDSLTLLFHTETADAHSRLAPEPRVGGLDNAFAGGARLRLTDAIGIVSVQASAETAGAFNFSVSANSRVSGRQAELRFLYGTNFKLAGRDGFLDVEAGERFLSTPRPFETPIDLTCGLWLTPSAMVMLQNFNLVGGGNGQAPYGYYRSHKLQLSLVARLSHRYLVQAGAFVSPLGQNALAEQGFLLGLWAQI